jgi:hypothetical protein
MRHAIIGTLLLACAAAGDAAARATDDCATVKCVEALAVRAKVSLAARTTAEFAGGWDRRGGFSGEVVYVLPDGTYGWLAWSDEWADFKVRDKGRWTVAAAVLTLHPDGQAALPEPKPRRYVALRYAPVGRLLVPFETLVARAATGGTAAGEGPWLASVRTVGRGRPIEAKDVPQLRKSFMRRVWSGGYIADERDQAVERSRQGLTASMRVVDEAERVEALPVTMVGMGLSSTPHIEERPVRLDAKTGRALADVLAAYDWDGGSPMACMFQPAVAFRFHHGGRSTQVLICFECGEMVLDGLGGPLGGKKLLGRDRKIWLQAAKQAFPNDPDLRRVKP